MASAIKACVILHNLVIDDEIQHDMLSEYILNEECTPEYPFVMIPLTEEDRTQISDAQHRRYETEMKDLYQHTSLRDDVINHIWEIHGHNGDEAEISICRH